MYSFILLFEFSTAIDVAIRHYGSEAVEKLLEQNKIDKFGQLSKNFESKSIQNENSSVECKSKFVFIIRILEIKYAS
jgi:hypothetical protein